MIYYNNDKCFLALVIDISFYVLFRFSFFVFQKAENNRLKRPAGQNFVILFFRFCLK